MFSTTTHHLRLQINTFWEVYKKFSFCNRRNKSFVFNLLHSASRLSEYIKGRKLEDEDEMRAEDDDEGAMKCSKERRWRSYVTPSLNPKAMQKPMQSF